MKTSLNRRVAVLKPSATMAAEARATELREQGIDIVSLAAGEPDFDTPERIKRAAERALNSGATKYTPAGGSTALRTAICYKLRAENQLAYEPNQVMASAGAKQAAANIITTLFDEDDEVLIPTPAWVSYAAMVKFAGAEPRFIKTKAANGFMLGADELRAALNERTKGIIFNSPCNPTGVVYDERRMRELGQALVEAGIWVLSDDVYERIVYGSRQPHLFVVEPRLLERGIVINSLSKTYAMTGWRLGFAAGPREVIAAATRLQGQISGNPNSIAQLAGIEALSNSGDEVDLMVSEFAKRRELVLERLRTLPGFELDYEPGGAFYVFPSVQKLLGVRWRGRELRDGDEVAEMLLEEAHVATVGGNEFGFPDHIRLSYATSRENLEKAFDRINRALNQL